MRPDAEHYRQTHFTAEQNVTFAVATLALLIAALETVDIFVFSGDGAIGALYFALFAALRQIWPRWAHVVMVLSLVFHGAVALGLTGMAGFDTFKAGLNVLFLTPWCLNILLIGRLDGAWRSALTVMGSIGLALVSFGFGVALIAVIADAMSYANAGFSKGELVLVAIKAVLLVVEGGLFARMAHLRV